MRTNYIEYTWENERDNRPIFPIIVKCPPVKMEYIHPLKQKIVSDIHLALHDDDRICAIVMFGSSVNLRCTIYSDSDFVVRLQDGCINKNDKSEISEIIQDICSWQADILWYDELDKSERIYTDILKGVQIV